MSSPDPHTLRTIEQAALQQTRALERFAEARDPGRPSTEEQRQARFRQVLEHLWRAHQLLTRARQAGSTDPELAQAVDAHLERTAQCIAALHQLQD